MSSDEFFEDIEAGNLAKVKQLVETNPKLVHAKHKTGASGILFALYNGRVQIADFIAYRKLDLDMFEASGLGRLEQVRALAGMDSKTVNSYSLEGFTPLGIAAFLGQEEVTKCLIENGAQVNTAAKTQPGFTPLTGAVKQGHKEIAEILLAKGANVNFKYQNGFTPLMIATYSGNREMTKLLLTHGADVEARTNDGNSALSFALEKSHLDVAALLREHGAKE